MHTIINFLKNNDINYQVLKDGEITYEGFYSWYFVSNQNLDTKKELRTIKNNIQP